MGQFEDFIGSVAILVASGRVDALERLLCYANMVLEDDQEGARQQYDDIVARWFCVQVFGPEEGE